MKKLLSVLLIMLLFVGVLAACAEAPEDEDATPFVPTVNVLNYAVFLSLLERNGFDFEEMGEVYGLLSITPRGISIGDDFLIIYEYDSNMAMETDAGFAWRYKRPVSHNLREITEIVRYWYFLGHMYVSLIEYIVEVCI